MIGVFDSGVGGLSVWREIVCLMPNEPILYLADQAHVPYGPRTLNDVRILTTRCIAWLIQHGCTMVVVACNTASAAALHHARLLFPHIPFVGMEPAVKPAASYTHTGVIGVLATQATFQGELFASVVMRFASNVRVVEQPCPGWVEMVESARHDQGLVDRFVTPLLDAGADSLVLGCTHFPFLVPEIRQSIAHWRSQNAPDCEIALVDPSCAVARQAMRVRDQYSLSQTAGGSAPHQFWTTGNAAAFTGIARCLLPERPGIHATQIDYADVKDAAASAAIEQL